jgi:hypothetical protein
VRIPAWCHALCTDDAVQKPATIDEHQRLLAAFHGFLDGVNQASQ